jgi:hypothetical protein
VQALTLSWYLATIAGSPWLRPEYSIKASRWQEIFTLSAQYEKLVVTNADFIVGVVLLAM